MFKWQGRKMHIGLRRGFSGIIRNVWFTTKEKVHLELFSWLKRFLKMQIYWMNETSKKIDLALWRRHPYSYATG